MFVVFYSFINDLNLHFTNMYGIHWFFIFFALINSNVIIDTIFVLKDKTWATDYATTKQ